MLLHLRAHRSAQVGLKCSKLRRGWAAQYMYSPEAHFRPAPDARAHVLAWFGLHTRGDDRPLLLDGKHTLMASCLKNSYPLARLCLPPCLACQ